MRQGWVRIGWGILVLALLAAGLLAAPAGHSGATLARQAVSPTPALAPIPPGASVVPGEVVVRFRPELGKRPMSASRAQAVLALSGITATVQESLAAPGAYVVAVPAGQETTAAADLSTNPDVVAADPNLVRHVHAGPDVTPNDPLYPQQWAWPRINAPAAWATAQNPGVVVAVLDTGLDLSHPEFAGRIVPGANFIKPGAPPQDDNGHGTHVAGIIAAAGNNGVGGAGLAWQARIMPIKVADSNGNLTSAVWINGLQYAIQNHAQVINMSFGGTTFSATEEQYIADAWAAGIVVVASAGNSDDNGNPIEYPAGYDNVLGVAATGPDDSHAYYSEINSSVDVSAPGGDAHYSNDPPGHFILSTWPLNLAGNAQPGYQREIGTSQAAAFVSGLAALMLSTSSSWTNATIVQRIEASATDLGAPGRDDTFGYGRINAAAALSGAPAPKPVLTPSPVPRPPATATPRPPVPTPRPPVPTPTPGGPACLYVDVCPADPYLPFIQDLAHRGAVAGFGDHTFRPHANISRGQLVKMLVLASNFALGGLDGPHFRDVPPTDPFYPYVETARAHGLIAGFRDGTFRPYAPITRGELAKLVVLARGWPFADPAVPSFRDVPYGSTYYFYVETAVNLQVLSGSPDATFQPDAPLTRGDASKILDVALATYRPLREDSAGH